MFLFHEGISLKPVTGHVLLFNESFYDSIIDLFPAFCMFDPASGIF